MLDCAREESKVMQPVLGISMLALLLVAPAAAAQGADASAPPPDERSLAYRYDEELGWFPKADDALTYTGSRTIHIAHNAMGFRDREHPREKTRPRLAFVGDSYVWGYDAEMDERFTELLQAEVPSIEVWNLGVSGYGTDQCYLLIRKLFDEIRPDAVVYMFSETDIRDNSVNFNYSAYYKPYFVLSGGELELRGVPVPRASVWSRLYNAIAQRRPRFSNREDVTPYLISALDAFVKSRGASFAVGLIDERPEIRRHLVEKNIVFFDLTHVDQRYRYPDHGFHWTPEGHRLVAKAIRAFLLHNSAAK